MHENTAQENLRNTMKDQVNVTAFQGVVTQVYEDTMSIDVYVPSTASIMYGVSYTSPTISRTSRNVSTPQKDDPVLIISTSTGGRPFAVGGFLTPSKQTMNPDQVNELLYPGENEMLGHLAMIRQIRGGSMVQGSKFSSGTSFMEFGKNGSASMENHHRTIHSDIHAGFSMRDIKDGIGSLFTNTKAEFYKELEKPCNTYASDQINDLTTAEILSDTGQILRLIRGDAMTKGFASRVIDLQTILNHYNSESAEEKLALISALLDQYIISPTASKLTVELGAVSNEEGNIPALIAQSAEGNDLLARLSVYDFNGDLTGKLEVDEAGNFDITGTLRVNGVIIQ